MLAACRTLVLIAPEDAHHDSLSEHPLSRFGTVNLDGTKVHASASQHSALSYGHGEKMEAQIKAEFADLLGQAETVDRSGFPEGMLPDERTRRETWLGAITEAKVKIEARAQKRFARAVKTFIPSGSLSVDRFGRGCLEDGVREDRQLLLFTRRPVMPVRFGHRVHLARPGGRTLTIHPQEDLWQRLQVLLATPEGRAALRERVGVEHGLAHVSQRQGNEVRYCGTRKNTGHLRLVRAIQNLEQARTFSQRAAANDAEPIARLAA